MRTIVDALIVCSMCCLIFFIFAQAQTAFLSIGFLLNLLNYTLYIFVSVWRETESSRLDATLGGRRGRSGDYAPGDGARRTPRAPRARRSGVAGGTTTD